MGKRLTDKQKKRIIAEYVSCKNYSEVARKHGISKTSVRNIVQADEQSSEKFRQKEEENTQDTLSFMNTQHDAKKRVLSKILVAIEQKVDNVDMFTNIKDLATAYGIILDKELKVIEATRDNRPEPIQIILSRRGRD